MINAWEYSCTEDEINPSHARESRKGGILQRQVFDLNWEIVYIKEAQKDMKKLDPQSRKYVLKAIDKVSANPLPNAEGGYGKPLGNHRTAKLSGYMKIKLKDLGLRVVYGLVRENNTMKIIIVSIRDDDEVYLEAASRIKKLEEEK